MRLRHNRIFSIQVCFILSSLPAPFPHRMVNRSLWPHPPPQTIHSENTGCDLLVELQYARIFSHNGLVIDAQNRLRVDLSPDLLPPLSGHRVMAYPALPRLTTLDARVCTLAAASSWKNYFHWIVDALPRARVLHPTTYDRVYTPTNAPWHLESLAALHVPLASCISAERETHVQCQLLAAVPRHPLGTLSLSDCNFLRTLFGVSENPLAQRRIYISRADSWRRRFLNEETLISQLAHWGFEVFTLTGLSIRAQAELFSSASIIVAPHGAALTNVIFAPAHAAVFEILASDYLFPHYQNIAHLRGLRYAQHISPNPAKTPNCLADLPSLLPALENFITIQQ